MTKNLLKKYLYSLLRFLGHLTFLRYGIRDRIIRSLANPEKINNFKFVVENHNSAIFEGNLNNYIEWYIYFYGALEKQILDEVCIPILKKSENPVFIDVGANVGNHSIYLAKECVKIIAFEPVQEVFNVLAREIKINNFSNIIIKKIGLGNVNENLPFYTSTNHNNGSSGFYKNHSPNYICKSNLSVAKGDKEIEKEDLKNIDLIKIDVEGFERQALEGIKETIESYRPYVLLEISNNGDKGIRDLIDMQNFFPLGYKFKKISYNNPKMIIFNNYKCILKDIKPGDFIGEILCIPNKL